MGLFGFSTNKCKTHCKLAISRIKLMRNKRQIMARNLRKEVAELIRQGKQANARIRVESAIREALTLQAYEVLELYLELLAVRAELLARAKELPPDMMEAVCSLVYAGNRISGDLTEVAAIRKMLVSKYTGVYGKEFAAEASSDLTCRKWQVNDTLVASLSVEAPSPETKLQAMAEICREFGVDFDADAAALEMLPARAVPPIPAPFEAGPGPACEPGLASWDALAPAASDAAPQWGSAAAPAGGAVGWADALQPATSGARAGEQYKSAAQAAEEARRYSQLAQQAADAAEAAASSGGGAPPPSGLPPPPPEAPPAAGGDAPPQSRGFVTRTPSEIQRRYDAAPGGPPTKGEIHATPSAPPAPPADEPELPAPPPGPPADAGADDITKRFAELKKR